MSRRLERLRGARDGAARPPLGARRAGDGLRAAARTREEMLARGRRAGQPGVRVPRAQLPASTASSSSATARASTPRSPRSTDLAERIHQPFYRWHGVCLQVIRAVLDGRFDDAERLAQEALRIARLRHSEYAAYVYEYAQLVAIRWAQGRLAEYWPEVADHSERFLWIPRWRDALAAAERGDRGAAALEIGASRGPRLRRPPDGTGSGCCGCARSPRPACSSATGGAALRLYELLLPFADRNAIGADPAALRAGRAAAGACSRRCSSAGTRPRRTSRSRWSAASCSAPAPCARACCSTTRARCWRRAGDGDAERAAALLAEARRLSEDLGLPGILRRACPRSPPAGRRPARGALRPRGRVLDDRLRRARRCACATSRGCGYLARPARHARRRAPRARAGGGDGRRRRRSDSARPADDRPARVAAGGPRSAARPAGQGGVPRPARGPARRARGGAQLRRRRARRPARAGARRAGRRARARRRPRRPGPAGRPRPRSGPG